MSDFEITGGDQLLRFSKALKHAGHSDLRKQLNKDIKAAVKPVIAATRAEARRVLPQRGGLAVLVAGTPQRVQVRTGQNVLANVRVIVVQSKSGAGRANRGELRHPVFADQSQTRSEWTWVTQQISHGAWFDRPAKQQLPKIQAAATEAIEAVAQTIVKGAH